MKKKKNKLESISKILICALVSFLIAGNALIFMFFTVLDYELIGEGINTFGIGILLVVAFANILFLTMTLTMYIFDEKGDKKEVK